MAYRKSFFILFVPRTGSTWLKSLCESTGRLGSPAEHFEPNRLEQLRRMGRFTDIKTLIDRRYDKLAENPVFSFKITIGQMSATFGGGRGFMERFGPMPCVFLTRRDLVLRAVSAYRKRHTKVGHSFTPHREQSEATAREIDYDATAIKRLVVKGAEVERKMDTFVNKFSLPVVWLSYEGLSQEPAVALNKICKLIYEPPVEELTDPNTVEMMRNDKSYELAERFRSEHPHLIAKIEEERRPILEKLDA